MSEEMTLLMVDATPPELGGYPGLRPSSSEADGMLTERDVAVPMRDGVTIYVDICRPAGDAAQAPVLIAYAPYGKHNGFPPILGAGADIDPPLPEGAPFEAPVAQYWVKHGYAVIYADPRGCWGSQGDASFFTAQEAEDGYDLVEWAGTRPWSNGRVGLSGVSYLAMSQYAIAATRPPHLVAINPSEGISDPYREAAFPGGIPETQFGPNWVTTLGFGLNKREDIASEFFTHPLLDDFWNAKTPVLESVEVPALFVCSVGNHGTHTRGTLEAYRRCGSTQKWLDVHGRKEWRYYYAPENMDRQRSFFDHFLKDAETDLTSWPPVRVEYRDRTETGPIRSESSWPPARVTPTVLYLDAETAQMTTTPIAGAGTTGYDPTLSPTDPALHAGEEKTEFDYTFDAETDLAGHCALRLYAASPGAADMDLFVQLDKIDSDGQVVHYPLCAYLDDGPLAMGWLRASHRELDTTLSSPDRPVHTHERELAIPDGPVQLDIEIWPFTAHFRAGETLRLTVAGANISRWPREQFVAGHDIVNNTAPHVLHTGGQYPSALLIPVVPTQ